MTTFEKIVQFNRENVDSGNSSINVKIGLNSGSIIIGCPVEIDSNSHGILRSKEGRLVFINQQTIEFIEVVNPEMLLDKLTDGTYFEVPQNEEVSKLALTRELEKMSAILHNKFDIILEIVDNKKSFNNKERYQMKILLNVLDPVFTKLKSDELGQEAIRQISILKIRSVEEELQVIIEEEKHCELRINLKKKIMSNLEEQITRVIETSL